MRLKRGVLIVLEGIDGSGKSTQARRLVQHLREKGYETVSFQEPSRSRWGLEIKRKARHPGSLSPEEELDLFLKDRRENVEKNLKPALAAGYVVILDRYYFSTMAYQGARGIDPEKIRRLNEAFAVKPDLVFILDVDPKEGLARIENQRKVREWLFEKEDYLGKAREIFRRLEGEGIIHIDARRPEEEVFEEIASDVLDYLQTLPVSA
ncbi:MAG: dTMP kinase [Candidatus Aminicenantales bacterium]